MIEFDFVLDRIGHLGRYQIFLVLLTYWLGIPAGLHNIASVFYDASVDFRCNTRPLDNASVYPGLTESDIYNYTTPYDSELEKYDGCYRYGYNLSTCDGSLDCVDMSVPNIKCDMGYHFDTSEFTNTVSMEWNLICDQKVLGSAATSIYFAGMWAGAIAFGYTSDLWGRRPTMFWCNIGTIVAGISTAFVPWFPLFIITRFLVAAFSHGAFISMCVYVMEITGKRRTLTGINAHSGFSIGYMLNALVAYFIRDWRWFYFAVSLLPVPYIFFHFFIPESPRFHFSNGRDEEGKDLSYKFARHNKKELPPEIWKEAETDDKNNELLDAKYSSLDLFKPPRMRLITLNNMFSWFVISLVYYGLSLNAGSLAGDIFLNNALNGFVEIVSNVIVTVTMDRLGRRILLAGSFLLSGVACISSMLMTQFADGNNALVIAGVVMAFCGKIGAGAGFAVIYNYTAELYPTVVRSNGLGVGSMAARWGSILSPFIILMQDSAPWGPSTVFGVLSLIAGALAFLFPETNKRSMPQTIPEAELFYRGIDNAPDDWTEEKVMEGKSNEAYHSSFEEENRITKL